MSSLTCTYIPRACRGAVVVSALLLCCLCVSATDRTYADDFARRNNEGNSLVEKGMLDDALQKYREAEVERPGAPGIDYNLGNVYHMKGLYDTAAIQYQGALATATGPLLPNAFYNLGNTLFRGGQYRPAVEAYKRALIENPGDQEAKYNLELALRRLQSDSTQQCDKKNQDQNQQPDSTGQKQDQNQQQNNQDQDSTSQQQNQNQNQKSPPDSAQSQPPGEPNDQQEGAQQAQKSPPPVGMTKEDAERILDALKDNEMDVQKKRAMRVAVPATAKDW